MLVLCTSLQNIVILSTIVIVDAGVKSTNVICPHNWDIRPLYLCDFLESRFCGHSTLWCKPSMCRMSLFSHIQSTVGAYFSVIRIIFTGKVQAVAFVSREIIALFIELKQKQFMQVSK